MTYKLSAPGWFSEVCGVPVRHHELPDELLGHGGAFFAHHGIEFHVQAGFGDDIWQTQVDRRYPIATWNVDDTGVVRQYADARMAAWHGDSVSQFAFGIEHTGDAVSPLGERQLDHSAALCAAIIEWTEDAFGETIPLKKQARISLANYRTARGFWDHTDVDNGPLNENGHTDHLIGRSWTAQLAKVGNYLKVVARPAPPFGGELLLLGADLADVVTWKRRMSAKGYFDLRDSSAGPHYGPAIERATRAFQQKRRLAEDGIVGPKTWAAAWPS